MSQNERKDALLATLYMKSRHSQCGRNQAVAIARLQIDSCCGTHESRRGLMFFGTPTEVFSVDESAGRLPDCHCYI
eukprot:5325827-Amphidinium_carterae.1